MAPNAPGLHEHKRQHQRSLPARAETATRHQTLLVCTSIKGITNAPCLHELKLQHGTKCSLPARVETANGTKGKYQEKKNVF
ncbi:hypothetical protein ACFX13_031207 [Malus domestica]